MRVIALLLFIASLTLSHGAKAEDGCPPGQYPQQGNGWKSCVPAGGGNAPAGSADTFIGPAYEARWVSLAVDTSKAVLGESKPSSSSDEAEKNAVSQCFAKGGTTCHAIVTAKNGCVTMAVSSSILIGESGPTTQTSEKKALDRCNSSGTSSDCRVFYTTCVEPVLR